MGTPSSLLLCYQKKIRKDKMQRSNMKDYKEVSELRLALMFQMSTWAWGAVKAKHNFKYLQKAGGTSGFFYG